MTDDTEQGAMAPFDAIPEVPPSGIPDAAATATAPATASAAQRMVRKLGTPGLLAVVALALGFGQSLALLTFFGHEDSHLSAADEKAHAPAPPHAQPRSPATASDGSAGHADGEAQHEAAGSQNQSEGGENAATADAAQDASAPGAIRANPVRAPDVLDTARDMLERGDVAGARRIATGYLLRIDGMSRVERERASAAYTVLGDAILKDYELGMAPAPGGDK